MNFDAHSISVNAAAPPRLPLPPREVTIKSIDAVVEIIARLLPIFDREEMMQILERVYSGSPYRVLDYVAINAINAIGVRSQVIDLSMKTQLDPLLSSISQTLSEPVDSADGGDGDANPRRLKHPNLGGPYPNPDMQRVVDTSWGYFSNAIYYLKEIICGASSVTAVQALLSLALYLEGSDSAEMSYMIASNAIRMALCIGLHVNTNGYGLTESEINRRQRIFWVCYIIDKDMTLRTGRPPFISDQDVSTEVPTDDQKSIVPTELFMSLIRFSRIQSKTYSRLYSAAASQLSQSELLDAIGELDKELLEWRDSMPLRYRPDHEIIEHDPRKLVHFLYIHLTYYNCLTAIHRMSLHHPAWRREMSSSAREIHRNPRVLASAALCVQAARASIYLLKYFDNAEHSCGWMVLYYSITSFVMLFANCLENPHQPSSRSDLALMNLVARFVWLVLDGSNNARLGRRTMRFMTETVKIATAVIERAERTKMSRTFTGIQSPSSSRSAYDAQYQTTLQQQQPSASASASAPASVSTIQTTAYGENEMPDFAQSLLSSEQTPDIAMSEGTGSASILGTSNPGQINMPYIFAGSGMGTDILGMYRSYAMDNTESSSTTSGMPASSLQQQQQHQAASPAIIGMTPPGKEADKQAMSSLGAMNDSENVNMSPFGVIPVGLGSESIMDEFESSIIPREMWNFPTTFSWDWGTGVTGSEPSGGKNRDSDGLISGSKWTTAEGQ
ncbi:fungal-specific transcription factor domain-containing protein [Kockiozyma suomiensis]|uniref:fungal-specific transcription factor domain-containing protein n=1 Tax=Kockiozyma suomiensis TaxID=1337062 RepID=UPI003343F669